jgi:hypothetical protein
VAVAAFLPEFDCAFEKCLAALVHRGDLHAEI